MRDIVLVAMADALKVLRVLVILPLLTKSLGVEAYGVWSQLKVNATFIGSVSSFGMTMAILRFLSGGHAAGGVAEGFNSALWTAIAGSLMFAALLLAWPAQAASLMFGDAAMTVLVVATALYVVLEVIDGVVMAYLRATRQLAVHLSGIAIEVLGELTLVWSMLRGQIALVTVVLGIIAWKALVVLSKLAVTWHQVGVAKPQSIVTRQYLAFGIPLVLSGLGYLIVNYGDRYFITFFMGIGPVGTYAAAYAIGSLTIVLCTPIDYVMYPAIAAHWNAGRTVEATEQIDMMLRWLVVLLVPILAGLAVLTRPLLLTLATEEVAVAAPVALLVGAGFAVFYIGIVGERVLTLANRPRTVTLIYAMLALVNTVLNLVLIPPFGLVGAAVATAASFVLYAAVTLLKARRHCGFRFPVAVAWRAAVAGGVGAMVGVPLAGVGAVQLALASVGIGLAYGLTLVAVGGLRLDGPGRWPRVAHLT